MPFNGRLLAEYYCGGMIFDHPDQLGSATSSTDCTGNVVNEKLYHPFGEFWTGSALPNLGMHQEFAQLPDYDPETDQYNTANRHYSPSGRWMSPDPDNAGADPTDPQTWNMYAYAGNNPTTLTDPTGLVAISNCGASPGDLGCEAEVTEYETAKKKTEDQPFLINVMVWAPRLEAVGAAEIEEGWEGGPYVVLLGALTFATGYCMQNHCLTFSKGNNAPPPPAASSSVSNTASPNPDPNQQKDNPNDKKKADDLIRGRLKSSKSYASEYGSNTYARIKELAKQGDPKAQAMKKLIEQSVRLMEKVGNK